MESFGGAFRFTLLTNDPALARIADRAGVERIGLDLERLGKAERQAGRKTRLSDHRIEDLAAIGEAVRSAELFVRINPINPETAAEVETALRYGANVLMLPYFHGAGEVEAFIRHVGARASVTVLVETAPALLRIREIVAVPGIDEVMFGLNDLRLAFGVPSHFEVLVSPLLDAAAHEVRRAGLKLSVGGIARHDDTSLPIPPDAVLAQYPRLGATGAWISRAFLENVPPDWDFARALSAVRKRLDEWATASPEALERARSEITERVRGVSVKPRTSFQARPTLT